MWKAGDGFGVFKEFGCRGFSSWVEGSSDDSNWTERGIEMEWAVPRGFGNGTDCADGAVEVNATAVRGGVRCACGPGFVGDGFAAGSGCFKSCCNDGNVTYNGDCCKGQLCKKIVVVAVGLFVFIFFISAAIACYFLLRSPPHKRYKWDPEKNFLPKIFARACRTQLFTYQELNDATKGFDQDQKLVDVADGTVHPGVLGDGSLVAVQRLRCESQQKLERVLDRVELHSHISHKNIARLLGCCISSDHTLLLVHEFFPNGTLKELLQPDRENGPLSWYRRINIATEIASSLAHLQSDISPPIKPLNLKSSDIFILSDYSVKIASFKLVNTSTVASHGEDVVYSFGIILLELIVGSKYDGVEEMVLDMINERRFHEIVDPGLRFDEQLPVQCEQIEKLAIFAVHCISRRGMCMAGAAKEFIHIINDNMNGSGSYEPLLEVTFSNSSLLEMISASPDTLHVS